MDFKKLLDDAQKVQKDLQTKLAAYDAKEFEFDYKGLVKVKIMGSLDIKEINILDTSIIDKDDKETLEDIILKALNNAINAIVNGKNELTSKIAGGLTGF